MARYFGIHEANERLVELRPVLEQLKVDRDRAAEIQQELERGRETNGSSEHAEELAQLESEVREIVRAAVRVFEKDLKCAVEEAHPGWEDPASAFAAIITADTDLRGMREMIAVHGRKMSPHLVDWMSRAWTAEDFTNANIARKAVVNRMWRMMSRYDFLLTPTLCVPPFPVHMQGPEKIEGRYVRPEAWLAFTFPMNLTGQPAATVPAGSTHDGLPVGMQIVGRHLDDATVMLASAAFEAARPWADKWPPITRQPDAADGTRGAQ